MSVTLETTPPDAPAGIGGVRHLEAEVAEIKSMFVSPAHRGLGLRHRILNENP